MTLKKFKIDEPDCPSVCVCMCIRPLPAISKKQTSEETGIRFDTVTASVTRSAPRVDYIGHADLNGLGKEAVFGM